MANSRNAGARILGLDALRGVAAAAVVAYHYTGRYQQIYGHSAAVPRFGAGLYGVPLFFIISGFVILMTVERSPSALRFVRSRFVRLFPAYCAAVAITFVIVSLLGLPGRDVGRLEAVFNLAVVHTFFGVPDVDRVYWTIRVELAFYALVCLLLIVRQTRYTGRVLVVLVLVAAANRGFFSRVNPAALENAYAFLAGVAIYELQQNGGMAPLQMLAVSIAYEFKFEGFRVGGVWLALIGIVYLVVASQVERLLRFRPLVFAGMISYSLYLVHQNIGYAIIRRLEAVAIPPPAAIGLATAAVLSLATLITFGLERPVQRAYKRRRLAASEATGLPTSEADGHRHKGEHAR